MKTYIAIVLFIVSLLSLSLLIVKGESGDLEVLKKYSSTESIYHYRSDEPVMIPKSYNHQKREFRGVWISTVFNIDMPEHQSKEQYQEEFVKILDHLELYNFNAMIFQVRPSSDALYSSTLNPWSRFLTGTEGVDPEWDPLSWMIQESHKRNIEFHAWFNPYRVSTSKVTDKNAYLNSLDDLNFAKKNPDLVVEDTDGKLILNPGEPQVKTFITNTVMEVVKHYDIDGIHFDDYFYPYSGLKAGEDKATFNTYKEHNQSIEDWRRKNVDAVIEAISSQLQTYNQSHGTSVQFGISPFGIWRSQCNDPEGSNTSCGAMQSYDDQYADTKKWVENNWLDYIVPQVYWDFAHPYGAPYADVVDWWVDKVTGTNVNLYIGHGAYKIDSNTSWSNPNEVPNQIRYNSQYDEVKGSVYFSYKTLFKSSSQTVLETRDKIKMYYNNQALTPTLKNYQPTSLGTVTNIEVTTNDTSNRIEWAKSDQALKYVLYRYEYGETVNLDDPSTLLTIIPNSGETIMTYSDESADPSKEYTYLLTMITQGNYESNAALVSTIEDSNLNQPTLINDELEPLFKYGSTESVTHYRTDDPVLIPKEYHQQKQEFRGVWVATVANIDMPIHTSKEGYQQAFLTMLDTIEAYNFNAIIFQVRPTNDAFYPSSFNPWSRYLTGEEGNSPGWDPLKWMIEESHARNIEFHAWFNPYRVSTSEVTTKSDYLDDLHQRNFARKYQDLVIKGGDDKLILNPGEPKVKEFIIDSILEVVENYEVDGIHFDDYFYPYSGIKALEDTTTYETYKEDGQSIDDFRRQNVDDIIETISTQIKTYNLEQNDRVQFGISPFGIWRSDCKDPLGSNTSCGAMQSYDKQYADTRKWVKNNWLDYIVPQIYWEFQHEGGAQYADIVDWWAATVSETDVNLYIGHGSYKYDSNQAWMNHKELLNQLTYNTKYEETKGSVFFSYKSLVDYSSQALVKARNELKANYWTYNAFTPQLNRYEQLQPSQIQDITLSIVENGIKLEWNQVSDAKSYVIYKSVQGKDLDINNPSYIETIVSNSDEQTITYIDEQADELTMYTYTITIIDKSNNETYGATENIELINDVDPSEEDQNTDDKNVSDETSDLDLVNNMTTRYVIIGVVVGLALIVVLTVFIRVKQ
ncbi:glycoside hydrolase family 10 protein [Haloplasma contractile]|uniref:Secreted protein n=1 Tax=Haloplasma contractile SSD-17B TaxID=1033810 RepID=F7PRE6_9MOLU|nr:family 10 glycosylhydrolase [Haloplasma contractile]ERJ11728.1 Putative secreted protein [Haloplasma contractile SSD-17B]